MRTWISSVLVASLLAATLILSPGCGAPDPSSGCRKVSIKITYKGTPVEGAQVSFISTAGGTRPANGTTDASGVAVLGTFKTDDGAMPGKYKVSVAKAQVDSSLSGYADPNLINSDIGTPGSDAGGATNSASVDPTAGYRNQMGKDGMKETESTLPDFYANTETSGLAFTVTDSNDNIFEVDLKDKK